MRLIDADALNKKLKHEILIRQRDVDTTDRREVGRIDGLIMAQIMVGLAEEFEDMEDQL